MTNKEATDVDSHVENSWFEKKWRTLCDEIWVSILWAFQNLLDVNLMFKIATSIGLLESKSEFWFSDCYNFLILIGFLADYLFL